MGPDRIGEDAMADHEDEYDSTLIAMLEMIWGEGFLSPGGPEAVGEIVRGLDLDGKLVVDIGCGIGGVDIVLARDFGARVIGLDVESELVRPARASVARARLAHRISCRPGAPGPLPAADGAA